MRRMYQKYVLLFNMNYTIRKSLIEDLADILCLRDEAREYMRENGNLHQWPVGLNPPIRQSTKGNGSLKTSPIMSFIE